jgi:hypothetical protein
MRFVARLQTEFQRLADVLDLAASALLSLAPSAFPCLAASLSEQKPTSTPAPPLLAGVSGASSAVACVAPVINVSPILT